MNRSTFKTAKGTELVIANIKGKEYLQVAQRILWFREEHPNWSIETKIIEWNSEKKWAVCGAWIVDEAGRTIANNIKSETAVGFADYLEKATTGAIGRALALCGYGTQFCGDELDEGERLADAPITKPESPTPSTPDEVPFVEAANQPRHGLILNWQETAIMNQLLALGGELAPLEKKLGKPLNQWTRDEATKMISSLKKKQDSAKKEPEVSEAQEISMDEALEMVGLPLEPEPAWSTRSPKPPA